MSGTTAWLGNEISPELWFWIEMIPIGMALLVIVSLGLDLSKKSSNNRSIKLIAIWAAILLIVAQSGWVSAHIEGREFIKSIYDNVWTIFNVSVMLAFLMLSRMD